MKQKWILAAICGLVAFACAVGHGLTAGTDLRGTTGLIVAGGAIAPAVWLVYVRILVPRLPARPVRVVDA